MGLGEVSGAEMEWHMNKLIGTKDTKSPYTGRNYCFIQKLMIISPGSKKVMLNQYTHNLSRQTVEDDGDIYIALPDLVKIFSPDWKMSGSGTVECGAVKIQFEANYRNVSCGEEMIMLKRVPFEKDEWLYIPAAETMEKVFGRYVFRIGKYIGICDREEDSALKFDGPSSQNFTERRLDFRFNKTIGDIYDTVWMPEANRLNVYRMYIPSSYDGTEPFKLLLCLHGGNGNSDTVFIRSGQKLQYYAEKFGYILLAPNSFVHGSNYGGVIPPVHMFPEPEEKTDQPQFYSAEVVRENRIAQNYLKQVLDIVLEKWNIDRYHIFVMGNSMGSVGTFHVLSQWPRLFRAGVPTGTMPLTEYLDVEALKKSPIYFLVGTEDSNDPADMRRRYLELKEQGITIRFQMIGGGYHSDAWVQELESIFAFFEEF